jgi:hypothetical protein
MTARAPKTCQGCGYRFTPAGPDDWFCSLICSGNAGMAAVLDALNRFARAQAPPGRP